MKYLLKSLLVLVFMLVTQQASAACWANANHVPPGNPPLFLQNGMWCTQQGVQGFQQAVLPVNAIQVPSGTQAPQGYCSWGERFLNVGASALVGGVLGALATDTDRGAGKGAALGGLVGVFIPCAQAGQVANTPGMVANQGVRKSSDISDCDVGKVKDLKGLSEANCKRIREALTINKPGHCIVGGVSYPELIDNEPGCFAKLSEVTKKGNTSTSNVTSSQTTGAWGYVPPTATPTNQKPCFATVPVTGEKAGCSSIKVVKPENGETRGSWEARVSSL